DMATFTTSTRSVGNHTITAAYTSGDGNFNASAPSVAITQTVNKASTTTTVSSSVNPSVSGQSVTFTATVTINNPGTNAVANPTGTVTFFDGGVAIGTGMLSGPTTDMATFMTGTLSASSHTITAAYNGDTNFNTSTSTALTQTVTNTVT